MKNKYQILFLSIFAAAFIFPETAFAVSALETGLDKVVRIVTGTEAVLIATVAVAGFGISALRGYIEWRWAGSIIFGIFLIFGAASLVSYFK